MQATSVSPPQPANSDTRLPRDQLARQLTQLYTLDKNPKHKAIHLQQHLQNLEHSLDAAYVVFKNEPSKDMAFSLAGEWMLDNFYIVKQTFRQIEEGLPASFFNQLPKLDGTSLQGYPRIYALAWEWVGYSQSQIDLTQTTTFVQEYQQVTPLMIGELWALPNMLRIAILEQLAFAVTKLTRMTAPTSLSKIPSKSASSTPANETIVVDCFLSLRLLSSTDWNSFFEQISLVEQILRDDPAGIYSGMDFETRNRYRGVIEELARHSNLSEEQVVRAAVECARNVANKSPGRKAHVGFYLIDTGRMALEAKIGYKTGFSLRLRRALLASPTITYLGSIALFSWLFLLGLLAYGRLTGGSPAQLMMIVVLGFGLALEAAITLVNWIVTHRIKPQSLPRMDFSNGITPGSRTMVVIPSLLESVKELDHLLQNLELYHLSNSDPLLTFALLTDFGDAPEEHMPEDEQLRTLASAGIENLNKKYAHAPFYLFHRTRQWNPSEGVWMGWERKRGKLADFNRLLLDLGETSYTTQIGNKSILPEIVYVITLDADTSLPQGSANRLIATLAHPLNHAEFSEDGLSVIAGYTVLQPRVAIKPTSANRSLFSRIYSGTAGFDLYSFAVSDVYQDLFGEGSYVGKGIYDVATFERSLVDQVRQNTLLSHDLFEGIHGRAALVTDIVLYEEHPSRYMGYTRRLSRWIRGDWQLLPWLFPLVRTQKGLAPNRLSVIDIWKIIDNLRRSLIPITYLALLVTGWLFLPGSPLIWTLLVLIPSALPIAAQTFLFGIKNLRRMTFTQLIDPLWLPLTRWGLAFMFLPYEAMLMLGAIGVTISRLLIVHRNMLQWQTAAAFARTLSNSKVRAWLEMAASVVFSTLTGFAVWMINPSALLVAIPMLIAWLISPQVAYWISLPIKHVIAPLTETQRRQIHRLARRTWAYFERFTGPEDHWLPPDHFQELPRGNIAHLTTPTNIGLFLVSTLSAYDLGYISLFELAVRLRSTFENLDNLEHYRGHLLNWYDTQTLRTLPPRYISTVDSGNLAACLITLKQGCLALLDAPLLSGKQWQGLLAILDILTEALQGLEQNNPDTILESFEAELDGIYQRVSTIQDQPAGWNLTLTWLSNEGWERVSKRLMELLESHPHLRPESLNELRLYLDLLQHHLQDMQRSVDLFAPWLACQDTAPAIFSGSHSWQDFRNNLPVEQPTLRQAAAVYDHIKTALSNFKASMLNELIPVPKRDEVTDEWFQSLEVDLSTAQTTVETLLIGFRDLAEKANTVVIGMDFHFLFDERRQVFHIGYNAGSEQLDPSFYDLLASEARIASLIAIAKGDVPQSHWQHLGRPVTKVNGKQVLLSWSGTMFEYLMPTLFTKNYAGTFLSESCLAALEAQISYGHDQQVPWGISESGYFAFDLNMNYQYRAFGVPDLGYKRNLSNDLVITPYASLIGLSLQPQAVLENMSHLEQLNMLGRFGFYEAIDYTKTRLPAGEVHATVQSYMAHHQGMILSAACNFLCGDVMVQRFHADERIKSVELLLQEKVPQNPPIEYSHPDDPVVLPPGVRMVNSAPWRVPIESPIPQVLVLSQGDTSLLITNAGGGYSKWREFALTRWQPDTTLDQYGTWIYLQDLDSGVTWSATCQPIGCNQANQEVLFFPHKAAFQRSDDGISLRTEITVSSDGVEIRRVNILNDSDRPRHLRLTSYGEVVLAEQNTDRRHPAFNKLFIESEYIPKKNVLIFQRRLRSAEEKPIVLAHALVIEAGRKITGKFENDRGLFLGRYQTTRTPLALHRNEEHANQLSNGSTGGGFDPIFSLTQEIDLKPYAKTRVTFLTLAAPSRAEALEKLTYYQTGQDIHRAFDQVRAHSERELLELGLDAYAIEKIQNLLSALLFPTGALRAAPHILAQNRKGQSGLWAFGISGDYPILLVRIRDGQSPLLSEALQAFAYWRNHRITVNLVILNDQDTGYALDLHNTIHRQIDRMGLEGSLNQRYGIFVLRTDHLQAADLILLQTTAGVILDEKSGTLAEHALRLNEKPVHLPGFTPSLSSEGETEPTPPLQFPTDLLKDNGLGGFSRDGREYIIHLNPGEHPPRPWINVIANPNFGFMVSEAGSGGTWAENSSENRLTPWHNDPVTDIPGEALYLRDEETGLLWSPTLMPAGAATTHVIRHGAGYSIFESQSHGLNQKLRLFADPAKPVKIVHLRLKNLWTRPRRITVTYYAEWVLGTRRDVQQAHVVPEFDPDKNALLAFNHFNNEFGERVAFLAANKEPHGVTADRNEFLGRMGSLLAPAALGRIGLASAVNAGLDPCAAIQLHVDLAPGADEEVFFLLGEGSNREESLALIGQIQTAGQVEATWQAVQQQWDEILDAVKVETPDPGMDLMLNRWLLYQTLSCRLWGRTALYQPSGAFGFRDQLQDVLALLHSRPEIARAHILEAARHQFEAGDVLHWWNPPVGRGVRTRFSDDMLWLPFVTAEYVAETGDVSILSESVPFLKGELLKPEEVERYAQYETTGEAFSLYQHCRRALEKGLTTGAHGLPLMGSGDWNDGMNRVGMNGRGESIWLGWFLHATLEQFAALVTIMKDDPTSYLQHAKQYSKALEEHAWDGDWYLRAYYDDGSPLGSRGNDECQIDSIAQSWAVLSGGADPAHAAQAIESVYKRLVEATEQMVLLFTPAFDKTTQDPGYIKGYPPGVRENGGQYTHAGIWAAWAYAKLGQGDRAGELFRLLNPTSHADTPENMARYKVEPYVIAADICSESPHTGSGGWTWYTGAAGWMYRLGIEAILGLTRLGDRLKIDPCIPGNWPGFRITYRFGKTSYLIRVENPEGVTHGVRQVMLDDLALKDHLIPLIDDGSQHEVRIQMGPALVSNLEKE